MGGFKFLQLEAAKVEEGWVVSIRDEGIEFWVPHRVEILKIVPILLMPRPRIENNFVN